jgi:HAD superfamily hydrolase (TIGR01490 family)
MNNSEIIKDPIQKSLLKNAVFFDVDNVLVAGQTQQLMFSYFFRKGKIKFGKFPLLLKIYLWFLLYNIGVVSKGFGLMREGYKLLKGWKVQEFNELLYDFFEQEIKPRIYPQALEKINFHQKLGYEIILISKSNKNLIDIIKNYLQLSFSIATELETKNEIFTGKIKGKIIHGEEKLNVIRKLIPEKGWNLKESYAYGDHFSDLPILKAVGHPCVVNPDRKLKEEAEKNGWPIFYWQL